MGASRGHVARPLNKASIQGIRVSPAQERSQGQRLLSLCALERFAATVENAQLPTAILECALVIG